MTTFSLLAQEKLFFDPKWKNIALLALLLHVAVILIFGFLPGFLPRKSIDSSVYMVNIVSLPYSPSRQAGEKKAGSKSVSNARAGSLKIKKRAAPSTRPLLIKKKKLVVADRIAKKKVSPAKPYLNKTKKTLPPPEKTEAEISEKVEKIKRELALKNIASKIDSLQDVVSQRTKAGRVGGEIKDESPASQLTGQSRSSTANVYALQGRESFRKGNLKFSIYCARIWEQIQNAWFLPPNLVNARDDLEAIVALKICRNGKIKTSRLEKGSGNYYFDESVKRAIMKANPLPPLPEEYGEEYIELGIRFRPAES